MSTRKSSLLSEVLAARYPPELIPKLDVLREVLVIRFRLSRSDVARAAIEPGAEELLRRHNLNTRLP